MANYKPAMEQFINEKVIAFLFELLEKDEISFVDKLKAASILSSIFNISKEACCSGAINCNGMVYVHHSIKIKRSRNYLV